MKDQQTSLSTQPPLHLELLSPADIKDYLVMRGNFSVEVNKSKKGERRESFINTLKIIRSYIERNDFNDWKRAMVCGIIFLNPDNNRCCQANFLSSAVAINIQQLRLLLGKCKSSINGSLQQLGYQSLSSSPIGSKLHEEVLRKVPYFQQDLSELKKWTFRENESLSRIHSLPLPQISLSTLINNKSNQSKTDFSANSNQKVSNPSSPSNLFLYPLPIINKYQKEALPTPLINIPSPSTPPEPSSGFYQQTSDEMTISINSIQSNIESNIPCPAKFRYKYLDTICRLPH